MILMCLSTGTLLAQYGGGGDVQGGGFFGGEPDNPQAALDNLKTPLGVTNDSEWNVLRPLIQRVIDAQAVVQSDSQNATPAFGGGQRSVGAAARGGTFGVTPNPEVTAIQRAVDGHATKENTIAVLTKLAAVREKHQAALAKAQDDLRQVVTVKQEAVLVINGYL